TVINGGIINAYGTNARMGEGDWMVVEADESDGTFLKLPADVDVMRLEHQLGQATGPEPGDTVHRGIRRDTAADILY
ncbi:hypothetical protein ACC719_36945, partial [Rhizobium ruizarguesonis]